MAGNANWLSTQPAAEEIGTTVRTLYRFIDNGDLAAYRFGRVIPIKRDNLDKFVEKQRIEPGSLKHFYPDATGEAVNMGEATGDPGHGDVK